MSCRRCWDVEGLRLDYLDIWETQRVQNSRHPQFASTRPPDLRFQKRTNMLVASVHPIVYILVTNVLLAVFNFSKDVPGPHQF